MIDFEKAENNFYKIKDILKKTNLKCFLNSYYNLTIDDILNLIDENKNIIEVKQNLFCEYKAEYANAWYNNFLEIMERVEL